jgi:HSP20 family protein
MLPTRRNRFGTTPLSGPEPLFDLRREIDDLFDSFFNGGHLSAGDPQWVPAMDVEETDDAMRLTLEVPGVRPEDLSVSVHDGILTVTGEKKVESREGGKGSRGYERRFGRFERSMTLPSSVDADRVAARYDNGVLAIDLPRSERAHPRRIEIARSASFSEIPTGKSERKAV